MLQSTLAIAQVDLHRMPTWCGDGRRCITDARGLEWGVHDIWSAGGYALLFRCIVPGVRAEIRATQVPLAALSDDELVAMLSDEG